MTETTASAEGGKVTDLPTLLDELLPTADATKDHSLFVATDPATVFAAAERADFLDVGRRSVVARAAFAVRAVFEWVVSAVRSRPRPPVDDPKHLRIADFEPRGQWVLLGRRPGVEVAFGVIGRFWGGETVWETISADEFLTYSHAGRAKIACSISVTPANGGTSVRYRVRTLVLDDASRRAFRRYWFVVSPFVGLIMRRMLRVIRDDALAAARSPG